jgi:hypothetical protein
MLRVTGFSRIGYSAVAAKLGRAGYVAVARLPADFVLVFYVSVLDVSSTHHHM